MRSIFGWSLPPGCSMQDINALSEEGPCAVCGQYEDCCICPECRECSSVGDPACYEHHGLARTDQQVSAALIAYRARI